MNGVNKNISLKSAVTLCVVLAVIVFSGLGGCGKSSSDSPSATATSWSYAVVCDNAAVK